jgi:hypothetical protein
MRLLSHSALLGNLILAQKHCTLSMTYFAVFLRVTTKRWTSLSLWSAALKKLCGLCLHFRTSQPFAALIKSSKHGNAMNYFQFKIILIEFLEFNSDFE